VWVLNIWTLIVVVDLMLVPDELTARLDELELPAVGLCDDLGDQYSVKLSNFCAMSTARWPAPGATASECAVMIVSLSDEASGDLADANLHSPYKSETNAPRTPSAKGLEQEGLGIYLTIVSGGLVAHLPPSEAWACGRTSCDAWRPGPYVAHDGDRPAQDGGPCGVDGPAAVVERLSGVL